MIQASQMNDDDEDASSKSQSTQASSSSQTPNPSSQKDTTQKFRQADYLDSQDPYDMNED